MLHDLKNLWKGIVEHMMGVLGRIWTKGGFPLALVSGVGWSERNEVLLEQVQL